VLHSAALTGHPTVIVALLAALVLGMLHGITPDEHTWPITFSYAVGSYSTKGGLRAGLLFSLAFAVQRAFTSELAYLGLNRLYGIDWLEYAIYVVVGLLMFVGARLMAQGGRTALHLHLVARERLGEPRLHSGEGLAEVRSTGWLDDPRAWMPAVHGFVAGWGFGAFAAIIFTVLAPAMPSAWWGWAPGALFGVGTALIQMLAGALFGSIAAHKGLSEEEIRTIALATATRTLAWGGSAFVAAGLLGLLAPGIAEWSIPTGIAIPNLSEIGIPLLLVIVTVVLVGIPTLVLQTRKALHLHAQHALVGEAADARGADSARA